MRGPSYAACVGRQSLWIAAPATTQALEEEKKTLKRMMVALLALLPLATGVAFADDEHGYSRIFIFGASFMDPGNHFALTGETAHPPLERVLNICDEFLICELIHRPLQQLDKSKRNII